MTTYNLNGDPVTITKDEIEITQFGCPWHGVAKNGALYDTPGGTEIKAVWPQAGPATQLLKVPGIAAVTRTTEEQASDAANNFNWKNYALVAGSKLYGQDLPANWIIYIDDNDVPWLLTFTCIKDSPYSNAKFDVTLKLVALFGRFAIDPYPAINTTIATASLTSMATDGGTFISDGDDCIERNSRGSEVFINIYSHHTPVEWNPGIIAVEFSGGEPSLFRRLNGVVKISISGNGSTDRSTLGDGITATIIRYKYAAELYTTASSLQNAPPSTFDNLDTYMELTSDTTTPDPLPTPPCPASQENVKTYVASDVSNTSGSARYRQEQEYILRYLFDGDTEVNYSAATWLDQEPLYIYKILSVSGTLTVTTTTPVTTFDGLTCVLNGGGSEDFTGGVDVALESMTYIDNRGIDIKRNGSVVDVMRVTGTSTGGISYKRYMRTDYSIFDVYAPYVDQSGQVLINNEVVTGSNWSPHIHIYSPQLFGIHVTNDSDSFCMIGGVATPWGSDHTHDEDTLTNNGLQAIGSCEPIEQAAHWYDPGVLDITGAKVNYV